MLRVTLQQFLDLRNYSYVYSQLFSASQVALLVNQLKQHAQRALLHRQSAGEWAFILIDKPYVTLQPRRYDSNTNNDELNGYVIIIFIILLSEIKA